MTRDEMELLERKKADVGMLDISQVPHPEQDRSLLYGYTSDRQSFHVYLKEGQLLLSVYGVSDELTEQNTQNLSEGFFPGQVVPNKRIYPEASDFEFCKLLAQHGASLPFTTFDPDRKPRQYHGMVIDEVPQPSNGLRM